MGAPAAVSRIGRTAASSQDAHDPRTPAAQVRCPHRCRAHSRSLSHEPSAPNDARSSRSNRRPRRTRARSGGSATAPTRLAQLPRYGVPHRSGQRPIATIAGSGHLQILCDLPERHGVRLQLMPDAINDQARGPGGAIASAGLGRRPSGTPGLPCGPSERGIVPSRSLPEPANLEQDPRACGSLSGPHPNEQPPPTFAGAILVPDMLARRVRSEPTTDRLPERTKSPEFL